MKIFLFKFQNNFIFFLLEFILQKKHRLKTFYHSIKFIHGAMKSKRHYSVNATEIGKMFFNILYTTKIYYVH